MDNTEECKCRIENEIYQTCRAYSALDLCHPRYSPKCSILPALVFHSFAQCSSATLDIPKMLNAQ